MNIAVFEKVLTNGQEKYDKAIEARDAFTRAFHLFMSLQSDAIEELESWLCDAREELEIAKAKREKDGKQ